LSSLITTINCIIKYLLFLPIQTSSILIYKELEVKDFKCNYNLSVLIQLYKHKHLIPTINYEHSTRYKKNIKINLPHVNKVFGKNSV